MLCAENGNWSPSTFTLTLIELGAIFSRAKPSTGGRLTLFSLWPNFQYTIMKINIVPAVNWVEDICGSSNKYKFICRICRQWTYPPDSVSLKIRVLWPPE